MDISEYAILFAMIVWAIYKQTRVSAAGGPRRFTMAAVYGSIGVVSLAASGWRLPHGVGWFFLAAGIALSAVIGVARGFLTDVWIDDDGQPMRRGTVLTVVLFLLLLAAKVGMGVWAGFAGIADGSAFGEVLLIVAVMIAVQAQIVHRRAHALAQRPLVVA